jgi:flagellar hook-length control protein FliK
MSITIVSAPPQSAPPSPANAAAEVDSAGLIQDFTSLLLGQLAAVTQPGAGLNLGAALQSGGASGHGKPADDEDAEAGDPLDVLAVLMPFDQASRAASTEDGESSAILPGTIARAPSANQGAADQGKLAANSLPVPASEPAAKFAALVDGMAGEDAARAREPAQLPPVATAVATGVQGSREAAPPAIPIPTPLSSRDWSSDFAQTVTWVAARRYQSADLTLNPPALGNIEISLKFDSDRSTATAVFVSSSAEVRETIETALPKLREMLAGAGIELGQANVSAESFRQAAGNGRGAKEGASPSGNELAILEPDLQAGRGVASLAGMGQGLVDMFV